MHRNRERFYSITMAARQNRQGRERRLALFGARFCIWCSVLLNGDDHPVAARGRASPKWLRRLSAASQRRFTLLKNHHRLGWLSELSPALPPIAITSQTRRHVAKVPTADSCIVANGISVRSVTSPARASTVIRLIASSNCGRLLHGQVRSLCGRDRSCSNLSSAIKNTLIPVNDCIIFG